MSITIYPPSSPIIGYVFNYPIRYYGLIMAVVFLFGVIISYFIFKKKYSVVTANLFYDYVPFVIIFSVFGARMFYVLASWEFYKTNLIEIFMINHGGLSIFGAIIAGLFSIFVLSKLKKFDFKQHLDVISTVFPLCQAIGRIGNYFNQEAYGLPTNGLLKLYVQEQYRYLSYKNIEFYHPTFLYEGILDLLIFIVLFFVLFKYKNIKDGSIAALYLLLYSVARFIIEGIRIDSVCNLANLPIARFFSILIFLFSLIALLILNKKRAN